MREAYRLQKNELEEKLSAGKKSLVIFFIYTGKEIQDFKTSSDKMAVILKAILNECAP